MKDHTNACEILTTGVCTCMVTSPHPHPRQGSADLDDFRHRFGREPDGDAELIRWVGIRRAKGQGNAAHPKAGTTRTVDTEPRFTWLGDSRFQHPPTCSVYKAPAANWAPFCDCWIKQMQNLPVTDPADVGDPTDAVPKEFRPGTREVEVGDHWPWWAATAGGVMGLCVGFFAGVNWPW